MEYKGKAKTAAKTVYASGCTAPTLAKIEAPIIAEVEEFVAIDLLPLLAAGNHLEEALKPEHWECHKWQNCPMAAAFGVTQLEQVPSEWREKAEFFVRQFDLGLIQREMVVGIADQGVTHTVPKRNSTATASTGLPADPFL